VPKVYPASAAFVFGMDETRLKVACLEFLHFLTGIGSAGVLRWGRRCRCPPALDQPHCSADANKPADTGLSSM